MNPPSWNHDRWNEDQDIEARLRRALTAEADMVMTTGDGLGRIRAGIEEQRRDVWWRRPAVALAAAALLGIAVAGGTAALNNRGSDNNNVLPADQTPTATASPTSDASEAPTPSVSPTESPSQAPAGAVSIPVYYLGSKDNANEDPRLYREFHSVPLLRNDKIRTALTEMFKAEPKDADYTSLWPKDTQVLGVAKNGDVAQINLSAAATSATNVGSGSAQVTLQQLVYTVTAADPTVKKVTLRIDAKVVEDLWGHIRVGTTQFKRAPMVDVQGLIWLLAPEEGAKVGRTVQIKGYGTAFEGTVSWDVRTRDGKLVKEGFTQAGSMGTFGEFSDQVTLQPGTYVLRAFESSAEDGRPTHIDDKTITVR